MKRINNLYPQIISIANLQLADYRASRGKANQYGVKVHEKRQEYNLQLLHEMLRDRTFRTSSYKNFKIYEPKERLISSLPYFPDRITHHAIMNILEPVFVSVFTADTYSCIKKRGIHAALIDLKKALCDVKGTQYCLKLDVKKFYPSIDHDVLKMLLKRKIRDWELRWLLDDIIDSAPGVPIGNYLSQYFANYYMSGFDYWIKQEQKAKYYFRYADDIIILSDNKEYLHELLFKIKHYLKQELKLTVKENYAVFPVDSRGIDFVGYVTFHTQVRIRKSIKQRFARMLKYNRNDQSIASYMGWLKHGNCRNLEKNLLYGNKKI